MGSPAVQPLNSVNFGYSHIAEFGLVVQVDMNCPIYNKQFFGLISQTPG
jgi:hypothetical protein